MTIFSKIKNGMDSDNNINIKNFKSDVVEIPKENVVSTNFFLELLLFIQRKGFTGIHAGQQNAKNVHDLMDRNMLQMDSFDSNETFRIINCSFSNLQRRDSNETIIKVAANIGFVGISSEDDLSTEINAIDDVRIGIYEDSTNSEASDLESENFDGEPEVNRDSNEIIDEHVLDLQRIFSTDAAAADDGLMKYRTLSVILEEEENYAADSNSVENLSAKTKRSDIEMQDSKTYGTQQNDSVVELGTNEKFAFDSAYETFDENDSGVEFEFEICSERHGTTRHDTTQSLVLRNEIFITEKTCHSRCDVVSSLTHKCFQCKINQEKEEEIKSAAYLVDNENSTKDVIGSSLANQQLQAGEQTKTENYQIRFESSSTGEGASNKKEAFHTEQSDEEGTTFTLQMLKLRIKRFADQFDEKPWPEPNECSKSACHPHQSKKSYVYTALTGGDKTELIQYVDKIYCKEVNNFANRKELKEQKAVFKIESDKINKKFKELTQKGSVERIDDTSEQKCHPPERNNADGDQSALHYIRQDSVADKNAEPLVEEAVIEDKPLENVKWLADDNVYQLELQLKKKLKRRGNNKVVSCVIGKY